ncbi:MAG: SDR family NAD(P)-dependent oxidoreductase [Chitinophagaceae bacterium]|nr:MAG: SDR family NAD(P)-dependent oxidoreductase [Chitinophagaceae bacterium]
MARNIIITGANGNLGSAAVKKFMEIGDHVVAVANSGSNLGFAEGRSNFELHAADLSNEQSSAVFFDELIALKGQVEGGLLLAGGFEMGSIETTDTTMIRKMIAKNFETVYNAARPLYLHMMRNNYGRLVFVGARPALEPAGGKHSLAYALSKSMLFQLAELLNADAGNKDVIASVVVPGILDTPANHEAMPGADKSGWTNVTELADLLAFICSKESAIVKQPVYKLY